MTTNNIRYLYNADVITIQKHIGLLLMQALNMGKISHYQILQLLN